MNIQKSSGLEKTMVAVATSEDRAAISGLQGEAGVLKVSKQWPAIQKRLVEPDNDQNAISMLIS